MPLRRDGDGKTRATAPCRRSPDSPACDPRRVRLAVVRASVRSSRRHNSEDESVSHSTIESSAAPSATGCRLGGKCRSHCIALNTSLLFMIYSFDADAITGGLELPTIRISEESMERLKKWAEPLEDTTESAFAKVLDAAERYRRLRSPEPRSPEDAETSRRSQTARLPRHSTGSFRRPLLDILHALGGRASAKVVRSAFRDRMAPWLLPGDLDLLKSGQERWWNNVQWQRYKLKEEGYFRADSPQGVWELSDKGVALLRTLSEDGRENFVDHLPATPDAGENSNFERPRAGPREDL